MCVKFAVRSVALGVLKVGILATRQIESAGEGAWDWLKGLYAEAQRDLEQARQTAAHAAPTPHDAGWGNGQEHPAGALAAPGE